MRRLLALLTAFVLCLHLSAQAAQSVQTCCGADCDIGLCMDMGCAPAAQVPFATPSAPALAPPMVARATMAPAQIAPPAITQDIWTPPD